MTNVEEVVLKPLAKKMTLRQVIREAKRSVKRWPKWMQRAAHMAKP